MKFLRKKIHLLLPVTLMLLLANACSSTKDEIPADILPREKLIEVLVDVQLAEAKIQTENLMLKDSTKTIAYGYYKYIFNKHKIDSVVFKKSIIYYSQHLNELDKIYDEVITGISKRQAESQATKNTKAP
jgi:hypothetical protein